MKKHYSILGLVGAATMLGGCQTVPLTSWMFKNTSRARPMTADLATGSSAALEEGRHFLQRGAVGAAIASFRLALSDPNTRADASNGLAVAYTKLGRLDLAERYFQAAVAVEPENPKFAANVLRLQQQVVLARTEAASAAVATRAAEARDRAETVSRIHGPAERISKSEVHVHSLPSPFAPPAIAVGSPQAPMSASAHVATIEDPSEASLLGRSEALTVIFRQ